MLLIIRGKHLRKIPREILDKVEEDVQKTKFEIVFVVNDSA